MQIKRKEYIYRNGDDFSYTVTKKKRYSIISYKNYINQEMILLIYGQTLAHLIKNNISVDAIRLFQYLKTLMTKEELLNKMYIMNNSLYVDNALVEEF